MTACFLGLFLLFSHVVLILCHCVLLDAAKASWENFSCVFCFMSPLIVSKLSGVCLFVCFEVWFLFLFASRSAVSLSFETVLFSASYIRFGEVF